MERKANSHFEFYSRNQIVKSKRSQGQIITTVLIILLILAAVVIVWQVIQRTTRGAAEQAEAQAQCIGLDLNIEEVTCQAVAWTPFIWVKVRRGGDSVGEGKLVVIVTDNVKESKRGEFDNFQALETKTIEFSANPGTTSIVTAALELADGTICEGQTETFDLNCKLS